MDFKLVLDKLLSAFEREGISHALMGGFALGAWGIPRATIDVDFLVDRDDMEKVDRIMKEQTYECRFRSENVSQYVSPLGVFGEVDFLHAFRAASREMLDRAEERDVFGGSLKVRVLRPEDLVGLKLQAIRNDPGRSSADMGDIESILAAHGARLDWKLIERYCTLLGMEETYSRLRKGQGE